MNDDLDRRFAEANKTLAALELSEQKYRLIFEQASMGIANTSMQAEFIDANQKFCDIIGYSQEELKNLKFMEITHPDDRDISREGVLKLIDGSWPIFSIQKRYIKKDGSIVWVELSSALMRSADGKPLYFTTLISDISDHKIKDDNLRNSERFLRESQSAAHIGSYNTDFTIGMWRSSVELDRIFGIDDDYCRSIQGWLDIVHPEWQQRMSGYLTKLLAEGSRFDFKYKIVRKNDQQERWVHGLGELTFDEQGNAVKLMGTIQDITEQKKIEEELLKSEELFKGMFDEAPLGIGLFDFTTGKANKINRKFAEIIGRTEEEILEMDWMSISYPGDMAENLRLRDKIKAGEINGFNMDKRYYKKDGSIVWINLTVTMLDPLGYPGQRELCMIEDISERKINEAKILNLSYYDQVTGLYNRRFYEEELKRIDVERNLPITLIMLDVNGLKLTNDAFGHKAGDNLLQKVGTILRNECRAGEIIARIGGDEFVILLPGTEELAARSLAERISTATEKERGDSLILSLSIGTAVKREITAEMNKIFKEAEDDMYRHKLSESSSMRSKTIDLIMNSLFEKNKREMLHSKRVGEIAATIATKLNFIKEDINQMRIAGMMHDIGKIGVSDAILNKTDRLTVDEWHEIRRHSEIGYRILSSSNEFSEIADYILCHHERWNGSGYPRGLKGDEISLQARIISIADAYDAMTSYRTYGSELSITEAIEEINNHSGSQFDPMVAKVFVEQILRPASGIGIGCIL